MEDGDGELEIKTYTYVYDNEDIILEYQEEREKGEKEDKEGKKTEGRRLKKTKVTKYVHGPGIDEPLAIERKSKTYYYHADGLGSITTLTDHKQKVVESYEYDSFGNMKKHGGKVKNTFTYTGREWDKETELYYYRARYYDAEVGRFISEDPIGFAGGINFFTYVGNRPINFIDPSGLYWEYSQSTGQMTYVNNQTGARTPIGSGYAGKGEGYNNPNMQDISFTGPIPQGTWDISNATTTKGPLTLPLTPRPETNTFSRDAFLIHGPNQSRPQSSSEGCIVIGPDVRNKINNSQDRELRVMP